MPRYKLNEKADQDLERLYEYGILSFGLDQADSYYDGLINRFSELAEHPKRWQAVDPIRKGYRRSVYEVHSIYYRIAGDIVEIMRILGREDTQQL